MASVLSTGPVAGYFRMSEALLYDLSQRLRLLARASVRTGRDGRVLAGGIDPQVEALRLRLLEALECFQDCQSLGPLGAEVVARATELAWQERQVIISLRRQVERESALEAAVPRYVRAA